MISRKFPNINASPSLLGFGCMRFPTLREDTREIQEDKAIEMIHHAYHNGINYFDTAYNYHAELSELFLAKALKDFPRESYYLADKLPIWMLKEKGEAATYFDTQLQRCNTTYFDFYLCHSMTKQSYEKCIEFGIFDFLEEKKQQGVIKHLGFSFHDAPEVLETILNAHKWDFVQIQLNYLDWTMQNAKKQYELIEAYGVPCIVMEPVRGGTLQTLSESAVDVFKQAAPGKTPASWALRYAASYSNVMVVLSGMSALEHVQDNLKTFADFKPISAQEQGIIQQALEEYRKNPAIPCTACRYCMDCPAGVDISKMFELYNQYLLDEKGMLYTTSYGLLPEKSQAASCVACNKCTEHCPQHIPIPDILKEIDACVKKLEEEQKV
ncbi:aldo/keto reductase [Clostridia bacterium OttesenSCG-928-F22]|nr:aldo/keto reductase [Clostridia bacterium OttesenSCG-928-F22]